MDQSKSVPMHDSAKNSSAAVARNSIDTMIAAGNFTTFAAAIKAAGLSDALAAKGPFTVFAPTDAAFMQLPSGAYEGLLKDSAKLQAILHHHVVSGYFMAEELKSGEVMTLQGSPLTVAVSSTDVQVSGAHITQSNMATTNGIVHAIDAVILPKNWQLLAVAA